jgi:hypothetical protein
MMGMKMPKTRWAVFKRQVINLRICCIWLVDSFGSMVMLRLANPKFKATMFKPQKQIPWMAGIASHSLPPVTLLFWVNRGVGRFSLSTVFCPRQYCSTSASYTSLF